MGDWLLRLGKAEVRGSWGIAGTLARRVAPAVVPHEVSKRGYVRVFRGGPRSSKGTGIEVDVALGW